MTDYISKLSNYFLGLIFQPLLPGNYLSDTNTEEHENIARIVTNFTLVSKTMHERFTEVCIPSYFGYHINFFDKLHELWVIREYRRYPLHEAITMVHMDANQDFGSIQWCFNMALSRGADPNEINYFDAIVQNNLPIALLDLFLSYGTIVPEDAIHQLCSQEYASDYFECLLYNGVSFFEEYEGKTPAELLIETFKNYADNFPEGHIPGHYNLIPYDHIVPDEIRPYVDAIARFFDCSEEYLMGLFLEFDHEKINTVLQLNRVQQMGHPAYDFCRVCPLN